MAFDSGDTAWVLTATLLVMMMLLPGLALFYGGLVRAKNLLSVMSQVMGVGAVAILAWVGWGYSLAFSGGGSIVGDLAKAGLKGIDGQTAWALATPGKAIPELLLACFQMTFAPIPVAPVAVARRVPSDALAVAPRRVASPSAPSARSTRTCRPPRSVACGSRAATARSSGCPVAPR